MAGQWGESASITSVPMPTKSDMPSATVPLLPAAIPLSQRDLKDDWTRSIEAVFSHGMLEHGADVPMSWSDQVFQPGYTFTLLHDRPSPFPEPPDYDALCRFARSVGDEQFLAQYEGTGSVEHSGPSPPVAGLFSAATSWDEMREATVGRVETLAADQINPLAFDYVFMNLRVWSPKGLWGLFYSDDNELAVVGTWGPGVTLAFRRAFGIDGDGWTDAVLAEQAGWRSAFREGAPLVTDLYVRRPLVPVPPPTAEALPAEALPAEALPDEEQAVLQALYRLALAAAQPGSGADAAGEAQVRDAIAAALRRDYRPAVVVGLDASDPGAAPDVRAAANAVVAAVHGLGVDPGA